MEENKKADAKVDETQAENTSQSANLEKSSEKTFSQDDVNRIITERLAREKSSVTSVTKQYETQMDEMNKTIQSFETLVNQMLESEVSQFDKSIQELLSKLSVFEKVEWINKNKEGVKKRDLPETPKPNGDGGPKTPYQPVGRLF